ncbi:MAG: prepilin-type N-terminal cleavage/methylation domain-containing protein [Verrucomicrobiales bacterium]|nr:prepilin-type N-terminal cleavage/methylation domain-containing protein [Verrucomicrobiales bacterium]
MLIHHIDRPKKLQHCRGMTLVEMMISVVIFTAFVIWALGAMITYNQNFLALGNYTELGAKSRIALDTMSRDIRNASGLAANGFATNYIILTNANTSTISYTWDGSNEVTRTYVLGGTTTSTVLMKNCDYLNFGRYSRVPVTNFQFSAASSWSQTKLIDVSWVCSRSYLGNKLNTESVQTARIVIRN